jgi:methylmalonyl-CoA mutase N-terminal domain/subunit
VVVGVNRFQMEERSVPTFKLDPELERAQVESLRQVRASRSAFEVERRLASLETSARSDTNLMPAIMEAAAAYVTVGEISDRMRAVFGEYRER